MQNFTGILPVELSWSRRKRMQTWRNNSSF